MDIYSAILAANWWEPGTANQLDVGDVAAILIFLTAVVGTVTGLSRWWIKQLRNIIREEVEEFTKPIQPGANGGLSLPDVARKVDKLADSVMKMKEENEDTREMLVNYILKHGDGTAV